MKFIMFQKEFAPLIQSGIKTSTIRPQSKRPYKVGEVLSARYWSEKPYHSNQVEFARIRVISANDSFMSLSTRLLAFYEEQENEYGFGTDCATLAHVEGFKNYTDMQSWFFKRYKTCTKEVTQYAFQLEAA